MQLLNQDLNLKIQEVEDRHASGVYAKKPIALVRGKGTRIWDANGREYLDCSTGMGVALLGHSNEYVVRAITEQAQKLLTCPDGHFYNDARAGLIEKLMEVAPKSLNRVFLCNTGTEHRKTRHYCYHAQLPWTDVRISKRYLEPQISRTV